MEGGKRVALDIWGKKKYQGKSLGEEQARPLKRVRRESGVDWSENS